MLTHTHVHNESNDLTVQRAQLGILSVGNKSRASTAATARQWVQTSGTTKPALLGVRPNSTGDCATTDRPLVKHQVQIKYLSRQKLFVRLLWWPLNWSPDCSPPTPLNPSFPNSTYSCWSNELNSFANVCSYWVVKIASAHQEKFLYQVFCCSCSSRSQALKKSTDVYLGKS